MDHVMDFAKHMQNEMSSHPSEVVHRMVLAKTLQAETVRPLTRLESLTRAYHQICGTEK